MDDEIVLDVRDDGAGFDLMSLQDAGEAGAGGDTAPEHAGGFGLSVMRQRIEGQSGTFRVESEPGFGTAVFASVPVQPCAEPVAESGAGSAAQSGVGPVTGGVGPVTGSAEETVLAATAEARG
jgi:signal transduction histidine kinase